MERNKCQKGYQMGSNGVCQPAGGYSTGGYMTRRDRLNMRKNLDMSRGKRVGTTPRIRPTVSSVGMNQDMINPEEYIPSIYTDPNGNTREECCGHDCGNNNRYRVLDITGDEIYSAPCSNVGNIPLCEETEPYGPTMWSSCWQCGPVFFDMADCTSACEYGCTDESSYFYNPMANNMCCGCCYQNPQQGSTRRMGGEIERSSMVRPRPRPNRRFTKPNTVAPLLPDTRDASCLAKGDVVDVGGQYVLDLKHCFDFDCTDLSESQVEAWVSSCSCNNAWGGLVVI